MLSCKKASSLIEKRSVSNLTLVDGFQLRMHLSMCKICKAYESQTKFIDQALSRQLSSTNEAENIAAKSLSKEFKDKIIIELDKSS